MLYIGRGLGVHEIIERMLVGELGVAGNVLEKIVGFANEGFAKEFEMVVTDGTGVAV